MPCFLSFNVLFFRDWSNVEVKLYNVHTTELEFNTGVHSASPYCENGISLRRSSFSVWDVMWIFWIIVYAIVDAEFRDVFSKALIRSHV